ncbi:hypothetical protein [Mycoplasma phocimorsus]|uniref:hypothetical protein n=1 Tax=Mycoplasma phocimorsus TaxID=3045839 RepID=UPI0024C02666|nr:hypothetical protein [Mycoplasma phocimorsus]MDJ1646858.1 hypothetical protein [Mycoplasma phocimorsus]
MKFKKILLALSVPSVVLTAAAVAISCGETKEKSIERKNILSVNILKSKLSDASSEAGALALLASGQKVGRHFTITSAAKIVGNKIVFKAMEANGAEQEFQFEKMDVLPEFEAPKMEEPKQESKPNTNLNDSQQVKEAKAYAANLVVNYKERFAPVSWEEMSNEDGSLKQEDFTVVNKANGYKPISEDRYLFSNIRWANKKVSDFELNQNKRFITFDLKNEVTGTIINAKAVFNKKETDYLFSGGFRQATEEETKKVQDEFISKLQVTEAGKDILAKLKIGDKVWYDAKDDKIFDKPRRIDNDSSKNYSKDKTEVLTLTSNVKDYEPRAEKWVNTKESATQFVVTKVEGRKITLTFKVVHNIFQGKKDADKFITKPLTLELSF